MFVFTRSQSSEPAVCKLSSEHRRLFIKRNLTSNPSSVYETDQSRAVLIKK